MGFVVTIPLSFIYNGWMNHKAQANMMGEDMLVPTSLQWKSQNILLQTF
jgi:hypothetical protein